MAEKKKDRVARRLANTHSQMDQSIHLIYRIRATNEDDKNEPIKFLEVNAATVPAGILPVTFGPSSDVPFSTVIVEVTPREYKKIKAKKLGLPRGWRIDPNPLYSRE